MRPVFETGCVNGTNYNPNKFKFASEKFDVDGKSFSLREGRVKSGLTQVQLAKLLEITPEYLSMLERGTKPVSKKIAEKFSMVCETKTTAYDPEYKCTHEEKTSFEKRIQDLETDVALLKKLILK